MILDVVKIAPKTIQQQFWMKEGDTIRVGAKT